MSIFGMALMIAWIAVCLAAGRVHFGFGFWAGVVAVVASVRVAGEAATRLERGEPCGQWRRGLLTASSGVVVTVVTGAGLLGLLVPVTATGLFLDWLDSWLEFTSANPGEVKSIVTSLLVLVLILGSLAAAVGSGIASIILVGKRLWPVAPGVIRGCLAPLRVVGVAGLVIAVGFGLHARVAAARLGHRIARVEGWAEAARREQATSLRLLERVERSGGRDDPGNSASAAGLRAEADHAGKVVRAEEDQIAYLRAEWRKEWEVWWCPPWVSVLAALALGGLAGWWVRRARLSVARGSESPVRLSSTWIDRLPSHRVPDRVNLDPAEPDRAVDRDAPTRSWPSGLA